MENNGGEIDIKTFLDSNKQAMRIELSDKGKGIDPRVKDKLFMPYFSTKREGTGLGLAIVNNIISDHKGKIKIEDNMPSGTRIIMELPLEQS